MDIKKIFKGVFIGSFFILFTVISGHFISRKITQLKYERIIANPDFSLENEREKFQKKRDEFLAKLMEFDNIDSKPQIKSRAEEAIVIFDLADVTMEMMINVGEKTAEDKIFFLKMTALAESMNRMLEREMNK